VQDCVVSGRPMPLPSLDPARATTNLALRVRFCETDLMGIVHHANYLAYFEVARVEWLRRRGVEYRDWARRGTHLAVVETAVRYILPARFDEVLAIECRLTEVRHASIRFEYRIVREGTVLTEGTTRLACVGENTFLRRFEPDMREALLAPEGGARAIASRESVS
jgi:acyl-CoA thioester hydrolase